MTSIFKLSFRPLGPHEGQYSISFTGGGFTNTPIIKRTYKTLWSFYRKVPLDLIQIL